MQNQLLLVDIPFRQSTETVHSYIARDGRALGFIIEELIAFAVSRVLVPSSSPVADLVEQIPEPIQARVEVIPSEEAQLQAANLLEPIGREIGARLIHPTACPAVEHRGDSPGNAFADLSYALDDFILAVHRKAQIDVDLTSMIRACHVLRSNSNYPRNRLLLADLQAVLGSYKPVRITSLELRSTFSMEQARNFIRLLQDERYRQLSSAVHDLGFPTQIQHSLTLVRRWAEDLLSQSRFSTLFNLGGRMLGTATGVPPVRADEIASLIAPSYLPPICNVRERIDAGMLSCARVHPRFSAR